MVEIAVTGTKGTTTVSDLIFQLLSKLCKSKVSCASTLRRFDGCKNHTSHEIYLAHKYRIFKDLCITNNCKYSIIEVSSCAEKGHRCDCFNFDWGVFTNFSKDHISKYSHNDINEYWYFKNHILSRCNNLIVNLDDKKFAFIKKSNKDKKIITYSTKNKEALYYSSNVTMTSSGYSFILHYPGGSVKIYNKLFGSYDVCNCLAAIAFCHYQGYKINDIVEAIELLSVLGRGNIYKKNDSYIVCDFAHNAISVRLFFNEVKVRFPNLKPVALTGLFYDYPARIDEVSMAIAYFAYKVIITSSECWKEGASNLANLFSFNIKKYNSDLPISIDIDRVTCIYDAVDNLSTSEILLIAPTLVGGNYFFSEKSEYYKGDDLILRDIGFDRI